MGQGSPGGSRMIIYLFHIITRSRYTGSYQSLLPQANVASPVPSEAGYRMAKEGESMEPLDPRKRK